MPKSQVISDNEKKILIYQYLQKVEVEQTPLKIATNLRLNYHTVRKYCYELSENEKINRVQKGREVYYTVMSPPIVSTAMEKIAWVPWHSIMLHYSGPTGNCLLPLGGTKKGYKLFFGKNRWISRYQHYKTTFDVWVNSTNSPLDKDAFLFFLDFLEGWSGLPVLTGDGTKRWSLCQYGLTNDQQLVAMANKPSKPMNIRLYDFLPLHYEFYDKQLPNGMTVRRFGIHYHPGIQEYLQLEDFLQLSAKHVKSDESRAIQELTQKLSSIERALQQLVSLIVNEPSEKEMFG